MDLFGKVNSVKSRHQNCSAAFPRYLCQYQETAWTLKEKSHQRDSKQLDNINPDGLQMMESGELILSSLQICWSVVPSLEIKCPMDSLNSSFKCNSSWLKQHTQSVYMLLICHYVFFSKEDDLETDVSKLCKCPDPDRPKELLPQYSYLCPELSYNFQVNATLNVSASFRWTEKALFVD